jgi:hypothetical protein
MSDRLKMAQNVIVEMTPEDVVYVVQRKLAVQPVCYGKSPLHGSVARPTLWLQRQQGILETMPMAQRVDYVNPSLSLVDCRTILGILAVLLVK